MILHAGFRHCLGEGCPGFPWCVGFWYHIELVCAYMGIVEVVWSQGGRI